MLHHSNETLRTRLLFKNLKPVLDCWDDLYHCSDQLKLATGLAFFKSLFSDALGGHPPFIRSASSYRQLSWRR